MAAKQQQTFQQEFGRLMRGAAQYASVCTQANSSTQETVDALYRYKVKRLCADISQALLMWSNKQDTKLTSQMGFYAGIPDFSVRQNYPRLSRFMPSARS